MDGEFPVVGRFFKVLVPGFQTSLKLPPAFTRKLKLDLNPKRAVLTSCKGSWRIGVKKCSQQGFLYLFGESWERYVSDHELKIGDFIVFEHTGLFHFNTLVFDETGCHNQFDVSENEEDSGDEDDVQVINGGEDAPTGSSQDVNSQFWTTLRKFHFSGSTMNIPLAFARSNGLSIKGAVTLRNATGDSWLAGISVISRSPSRKYRVRLRSLGEFFKGNKLKVGDECIFKLSQNQKHLVMDVHFVRNVVSVS